MGGDQLIPGAAAAAAAPPAAAAAAPLRKTQTVPRSLAALDQAVPGAGAPPPVFLPMPLQHMATAGMGVHAMGGMPATMGGMPAHMGMLPPAFFGMGMLPHHAAAMHAMAPGMGMMMPGMGYMGMGMPPASAGAPATAQAAAVAAPAAATDAASAQPPAGAAQAAAAATAAAAAVMEERARGGKVDATAASAAAAAAASAAAAAAVGGKRGDKRPASGAPDVTPPPAQKPRWETPLRVGNWAEAWESATALAGDAPTVATDFAHVSKVVRATLADVIISYVGEQLPRATVEKWLCLLSEYLELNADEQILVVCLLRRFVDAGGRFVGDSDHLRPQTWERVVAVACYLAVMLSEEFPGRAASDLRELLGPNFRFGQEQIIFLKTVDWRVSVSHEAFVEVKRAVAADDHDTLVGWFKTAAAVTARRARADAAAKEAKDALAALAAADAAKVAAESAEAAKIAAAAKAAAKAAALSPVSGVADAPLGKKKRAASASGDDADGVVPGATDFAGPWSTAPVIY